jgi:tripartite tricarboxylate transporter family receptor
VRRREFITLLASAAAWPLAARAQQANPLVGVLHGGLAAAFAPFMVAFRRGLEEGGFITRAQAYPARPVRLIAPFAPGGLTDIIARLMGQWLSERIGQQFVIDNRPGGGGNIGTEAVVRAPADGYTLLLASPRSLTAHAAAKVEPRPSPVLTNSGIIPPALGGSAAVAGNNSLFTWQC